MMTSVAVNLLLDSAESAQTVSTGLDGESFVSLVAGLAYHAMLIEVHLTPKPGLVDLMTNGAHNDMNVALFETSAAAIRPYLKQFIHAGMAAAGQPAEVLLKALRPIGLLAERAMFRATRGVNTHKGMIFGMGLICGASGWLKANGMAVKSQTICPLIRRSCATLVCDELVGDELACEEPVCEELASDEPEAGVTEASGCAVNENRLETHGEMIYRKYGLTGARGEAASGYRTITHHSLPAYCQAIADGCSIEQALWHTLLVLMACNEDTNVVARGGMPGLRFVRHTAGSLLTQSRYQFRQLEAGLIRLDRVYTERRLSPGGSADLLAMTWLLAQIDQLQAG